MLRIDQLAWSDHRNKLNAAGTIRGFVKADRGNMKVIRGFARVTEITDTAAIFGQLGCRGDRPKIYVSKL